MSVFFSSLHFGSLTVHYSLRILAADICLYETEEFLTLL